MSRAQVSTIINSPSFQHQFAIKRKELEASHAEADNGTVDLVTKELKDSALAAAQKLTSGLSCDNPTIALKSAIEILDRSGYPKEQKLSGQQNTTQIIISSKEMTILNETISMEMLNNLSAEDASITEDEKTKETEMPVGILSSDSSPLSS
jgi:hypothetical protein